MSSMKFLKKNFQVDYQEQDENETYFESQKGTWRVWEKKNALINLNFLKAIGDD